MSLIHIESALVLAVQKPNPSVFSEEWLEDKGILHNLEITKNSQVLDGINDIEYEEHYAIQALDNRIILSKSSATLKAPEPGNDELLAETTLKMIDEIAYMEFFAVGINYRFIYEYEAEKNGIGLAKLTHSLGEKAFVNTLNYNLPEIKDGFHLNNSLLTIHQVEENRHGIQIYSNFQYNIAEGLTKDQRKAIAIDSIGKRIDLLPIAKEIIYALDI